MDNDKPSDKIREGLNRILSVQGNLNLFADTYGFDFGSLYKLARGLITQPGVDYGCAILDALKDWQKNK